jgi:hypothetical protein
MWRLGRETVSEIRVNVTVTFAVDGNDWREHRQLDPRKVRENFLHYVRSRTLGGLAGHISLGMTELEAVHGRVRLGTAELVPEGNEQP